MRVFLHIIRSCTTASLAALLVLTAPALVTPAAAGQASPASLSSLGVSATEVTVGTPVVFTAGASGGTGSIEYRFDLYDAGHASWTLLQAYGSNSAVTWTPSQPGTYWVQVWVRAAGSSSDWEDWRNSAVVSVAGLDRCAPALRCIEPRVDLRQRAVSNLQSLAPNGVDGLTPRHGLPAHVLAASLRRDLWRGLVHRRSLAADGARVTLV